MSWKAILIAASVAPLAGCRLFESAARNALNEPLEYLDERKVSHEARRDADRVWEQLCAANPDHVFTKDYSRGFKDGYADYLDNGGPGTPPPIPPRYYRRSGYLNPEGHALIRDWFSGFQQGIDIAIETGKRGYLTIPVLLPEPEKPVALDVKQVPSDDCAPNRDPRKPGGTTLPPIPALKPIPAEAFIQPAPVPGSPTDPKSPTPTPVPPPNTPAIPQNNPGLGVPPPPGTGIPFPGTGVPAPAPGMAVPPPPGQATLPNPGAAPNLGAAPPANPNPGVSTAAPVRNSVLLPMPMPAAVPAPPVTAPPAGPRADAAPPPPMTRYAPPAPDAPTVANGSDSFTGGRYQVSPVNEGLRVIVRPVKDSK